MHPLYSQGSLPSAYLGSSTWFIPTRPRDGSYLLYWFRFNKLGGFYISYELELGLFAAAARKPLSRALAIPSPSPYTVTSHGLDVLVGEFPKILLFMTPPVLNLFGSS